MRKEREVQIYILGKSFPPPDKHFGDRDCIGGVRIDGEEIEWIRLYPVVRRKLKEAGISAIPSFSLIECTISKHPADKRVASYQIWEPSVKIIKKKLSNKERFEVFSRIISPHLEYLEKAKEVDKYKTSLGLIEVEITDYRFRKLPVSLSEEEVEYIQMEMFEKVSPDFQKPGHNLTIKFRCKNNKNCKGHNMVYKSEEFETAYNKFIKLYPDTFLEKLGEEFEKRYINPENVVYAIIGTMRRKYYRWLLGGLTHLKRSDIQRFKKQSKVLDLPLEFPD